MQIRVRVIRHVRKSLSQLVYDFLSYAQKVVFVRSVPLTFDHHIWGSSFLSQSER